VILALAVALLLASAAGPVPAKPPVLENETVYVDRPKVSPGGGVEFPASRTPQLVVYLSKGVAEIRLNGETSDVLRNAGAVTFVPMPFELLSISIK
jgi:hypothetical protein